MYTNLQKDLWQNYSLNAVSLYIVLSLRILVISVYLSSLPAAHLSDSPKRRLVVKGIVQGYRRNY